jgi:hypothetical protein
MNRRKFLFGSGVAVAAAPLLAKLPAPPVWTRGTPVIGRMSGPAYPHQIPRYGVLSGGVSDSSPGQISVEQLGRIIEQVMRSARDSQERIVYAVLTGGTP